MIQPTLVISVAALAFTLFSFWWMNWRPGKLVVTAPRSYAAIAAVGKIMVEIPLVFFNKGATPIVVHNLRLVVSGVSRPLFFNAVVQKLGNHDDRRFATQFAVRQQEALMLICEFQAEVAGFVFERREYQTSLEWARGNSRRWRTLLRFSLNVTEDHDRRNRYRPAASQSAVRRSSMLSGLKPRTLPDASLKPQCGKNPGEKNDSVLSV